MSYGTVTNLDDSATVRFDRSIPVSLDRVWRALTDPKELSAWLTSATLEPHVGSAIHFDFGEDQQVDGVITSWDPPTSLEYTWTFTGEPDSILRFELAPAPEGTRLILEHRQLPAEQAPGYGAGWHAHLDGLASHLVDGTQLDWDERFNEVLGAYVGA